MWLILKHESVQWVVLYIALWLIVIALINLKPCGLRLWAELRSSLWWLQSPWARKGYMTVKVLKWKFYHVYMKFKLAPYFYIIFFYLTIFCDSSILALATSLLNFPDMTLHLTLVYLSYDFRWTKILVLPLHACVET